MGGEYKRIILLKGLELINDYQFSIVKSLLARDLGLTANMQEEYNKVKIADLMEKKFPGAACVDKLIDLFKDMPPLKDIVKQLRNEKMKGNKEDPTTDCSTLTPLPKLSRRALGGVAYPFASA